jgi:phage baseplate assembly protein W
MAAQFKKFYVGFSTRNYEEQGGSFDTYNVGCIEQDLINAIFTERGQRVMMPNYGTRIPLLVFEPGDQQTIDVIIMDLTEVFDNEPRVKLLNLDVIPVVDQNALVAVAKVQYLEFNVTQNLSIEVHSK